jgi:hypothetical protein
MKASEISDVVHTAPTKKKTVSKRRVRRRSRLAKDIITLLGKEPNLTHFQICQKIRAKPHSIRSVLWKLVHRQNKIFTTRTGRTDTMTGPRVVYVYCLVSEGQPDERH